jgi:hypothetical protein
LKTKKPSKSKSSEPAQTKYPEPAQTMYPEPAQTMYPEPAQIKPSEPTPVKFEPVQTKSLEPRPVKPTKDVGCNIDIQIENRGEVNIYNCSSPCPPSEGDKDHDECPPTAPGACVPVSLGSKPKQSRRFKLNQLLANTRVPSTLGASFFHTIRRYVAGKSASNSLEQDAFEKLSRLSPELQRVVRCTVDSFESLSNSERNRLFVSDLLVDINQPVDASQLIDAFNQELIDNTGIAVFDDPRCATEEHPGLVRTQPHPGIEPPPAQVVVCRINGLRTVQFRPPLTPGDYTPAEIQQACHIVLEGGQPKQVCEVQTTNCPDGTTDGTSTGACLRVLEFEAGQTVMLEGMNFSSVDTKIRLSDAPTGSIVREVDAQVCGDEETPLTEVVNGENVPIIDCRVHDRLTFRIPDDLALGLYDLVVLVPNVNNVPVWGPVLASEFGPKILVIPPATARFQIASETLHCVEETSPASFGSDEVGIKILAIPLLPNLTPGETQEPNGGEPIRFDDVDSGDERAMDHLLFSHQQQIIGLAMSIRGFEVDGEDAFKKEIEDWTKIFVDILKDQLDFVMKHLEDFSTVAAKIGAVYSIIAAVVVLAIDLFVALWAPADPIIEDMIGPTVQDLIQLTNVNLPMPLPSEHLAPTGIKVKVTPLEKIPQQYREMREYISDDEDSRYQIVLRYNRLV